MLRMNYELSFPSLLQTLPAPIRHLKAKDIQFLFFLLTHVEVTAAPVAVSLFGALNRKLLNLFVLVMA